MFQIKICGVRRLADVESVLAAGADAVGFNFVPGSRRAITLPVARQLAQAALPIQRVGVFVDAPRQVMQAGLDEGLLDLVQLHGDEPDAVVRSLAGAQVVRAVRLRQGLDPVRTWLQAQRDHGWAPAALLLDAFSTQEHGGTGQCLDWHALQLERPLGTLLDVPVILAGGLTPGNVAQAIQRVQPAAVDVASGVESAPGEKDPARVRDFVAAARAAFAELDER